MSKAFIRNDTSRKADINYICGSSGAGKSSFIKKQIETDKRILVFDPDDEYGDVSGICSFNDGPSLFAAIQAHKTTPFRARLVASGQEAFELCNAIVFAWTNCTYVAEEIADVTRVGKAPPQWGQVLRRGRKRAIKVYPVTQRPAEADKTALTQATVIRTGLLGNFDDQVAMAKIMNIPKSYIDRMGPLDFIESYRNAQRQVFVGNAEAGTRVEITAQVRSASTEKAPEPEKTPAKNPVKAARRNAADKAGQMTA